MNDEEYREHIRRAMGPPPAGSRADIENALEEFRHDRLPVHVGLVCMVVTIRDYGWRRWVRRFALWALARAGYEVVRPRVRP